MADGKPCLVLLEEQILLKILAIEEKKDYIIGRADACDFVIDGKEVSRRHARVFYDGNIPMLEDLKSTNGTFVNGKRVETAVLRHNDEINIGNFTIVFDDGRGIEGVYEETQTESAGNETQRLVKEYRNLAEKIRERDIALDLKRYHEKVIKDRRKLTHLANRDRLTGLYNRRYFDKIFEQKFKEAHLKKYPLCLLFVDIDHFKKVNDTFGHEKGDEVLRGVAQIIHALCRKEDIVARYGGEEFVLLFCGMDSENGAQVAETIRRIVEEKSTAVVGFRITISIGVSVDNGRLADPGDFLRSADSALYTAKSQGRNRVVIAND